MKQIGNERKNAKEEKKTTLMKDNKIFKELSKKERIEKIKKVTNKWNTKLFLKEKLKERNIWQKEKGS